MRANSLDLNTCTGEHTTCPVTQECRMGNLFFGIVEIDDPEMLEDTEFYTDFIQKCEDGTCPGQKMPQFIDALQLVFDAAKQPGA